MASFIIKAENQFGDVLPAFLTTTPWQVNLAKKMFDETGDSSLKSFFGAQGWNTGLIDNLNKLSKDTLLPGADLVTYMTANSNVSSSIVNSFLSNIATYEGQDVKEGPGEAVEKVLEAGESAASGIGETAKFLPVIIGLLAVGVTGYLIYAGRKGVKLTPL